MSLIESFTRWKKYCQLPFLTAIEHHDICAPQLVICLDPNDTPTCYLIHYLEWGNWLVINGFKDIEPERLVDVFKDETLYMIKEIPSDLKSALPSIINGERKIVNVQIWREGGLKEIQDQCQMTLPQEFLEMYEELPELKNYATLDFNLFVELEIRSDWARRAMVVQEWFVFARERGSLVAVNCNPSSHYWGRLIYIIEGERAFENTSIRKCTISRFRRSYRSSYNRLENALVEVELSLR